MSPGLLKKLFVVVSVLLAVSLALGVWSFYQLNVLRNQIDLYARRLQMQDSGTEAQILSGYAEIRRQINLRMGVGPNSRCFIMPDAPEVAAVVQEVTGGFSDTEFWKDFKELFRWMVRNVEYSRDSPIPVLPKSINGTLEWGSNFWRTPAETISDGAGDCEDHAALLTSMLLNYSQRRFPVWIVGVRNYGLDPRAHIAVAIPIKNNRLAIWDTSARYYTRFPEVADFGSRELPVAIDLWLKHLQDKVPNAQVYVAFSEDFYRIFSSNEEFIAWAAAKMAAY
jgi:hypothetical protein